MAIRAVRPRQLSRSLDFSGVRVETARLRGTSRLASAAAPPDLVLDGRIDGWISVEPRAGEPRRVSVVAGPGEDPFVGPLASPDGLATDGLTPSGAAPSATPGQR